MSSSPCRCRTIDSRVPSSVQRRNRSWAAHQLPYRLETSREGVPERFGLEDATRAPPMIIIRTAPALNLRQKEFDTFILLIGEPTATASVGIEV